MRTQIQRKEKTGEAVQLGEIFDDVSELLDVGFSIFGTTGKIQGGESKGKGLFGLINDLAKLAEKSESYQKRIKLGEKGVVDFRVKSGPIRKSYATKPTGGLKISKPKKEISHTYTSMIPAAEPIKEREPIVDVFEEGDNVRVMVELPGIKENEISLEIEDNALTISTDTPARKYYKKLEFPNPVKKNAFESSYRNGILEVKLRKTKKDA